MRSRRHVEALLAGFTRIRLLNIREIRTHRLRLFTSLAVVIVSSALLIAVLGTFGSTSESVRAFNNAISGSADLEVAAIADSGVDQSLAGGEIRRDVDGAKAVVPMIRGSVVVDDSSIPLIGSDQRVVSLSGGVCGPPCSRRIPGGRSTSTSCGPASSSVRDSVSTSGRR